MLVWSSSVQTPIGASGCIPRNEIGAARISGRARAAEWPLKVLVAEDDAVNRMVVSKMLGAFDVELRVVADGDPRGAARSPS